MKRTSIINRTPIIEDQQHKCPYETPYGYIYKITNKINGHYYIGQHRFDKPYLDVHYNGSGVALHKAYQKYGMENFEEIILEWTDKGKEELDRLEILYIDVFDAYRNTKHYNLTNGGDGVGSGENSPRYGKTCTEETRQKMKEAHLGKYTGKNNPMYGDHRFAGKNNPMYGKKCTDEQKQQQSKLKKEYFQTKRGKEQAKHHSENMTKYFQTEQGIKSKQKMREAKLGKYDGKNNPSAKQVVQLTLDGEFVREYSYLREVKQYGFPKPDTVSACCKGRKKSYKGFLWMYKEDYLKLNKSIDEDD